LFNRTPDESERDERAAVEAASHQQRQVAGVVPWLLQLLTQFW
jgi:hypothetical protein